MSKMFIPKQPMDYPAIGCEIFIARDGKIIFLNEKNCKVLQGYKAQVIRTKGEILISITGLSKKSMEKIMKQLEPLKEVTENGV